MITRNKKIINQFLKEYTPTMKKWYGDYSIHSMSYRFLKIWEMPEEVIDKIISTNIDVFKRKHYNVSGFPEYYLTSVLYLLNHYNYFNFERFKICLNNYVEISKKCREIDKEYPCAEDQYLPEDSGFELLGKYSKLLNSDQLKEIEKIIEDNISEFIGYESYNYKWNSQIEIDNLALMTPLQEYFCFTPEFLRHNKKYFTTLYLMANDIIRGSLDHQYVVFGEVLEEEMNRRLRALTRNGVDKEIKIDDEKRDEMILKFSLD